MLDSRGTAASSLARRIPGQTMRRTRPHGANRYRIAAMLHCHDITAGSRTHFGGLVPVMWYHITVQELECVTRFERTRVLWAELVLRVAGRPPALARGVSLVVPALRDRGRAPHARFAVRTLDVRKFLRLAIEIASALRHMHRCSHV